MNAAAVFMRRRRTPEVRARCAAAALAAALLALGLVLTPAAQAQPSVVLTTDFPGIAVKPGEVKTLSLTLYNYTDAGRTVDLSVVRVPSGWEAVLKARGMRVHRAYVGPKEENRAGSTYLDLEVRVPRDARPGDYPIVLTADASRLELSLRVARDASEQQIELTTQYPELRGPAGAQFQFPVDLTNRTGEDQTFQLSVQGPQGWRVELTPRFEERQVASIGVRNGATQSLEVKVTPPERVEAGSYPIVVKAASPSGEATLNLNTVVIGTYELQLTTPTGRLNAQGVAGRDNPLKLVVQNTGTADLHNITFSSDVPMNWVVKFDPQRIDLLPAGKTQEVTATLRPDSRAIAGDYAMTLRAQAAEASTSSTFRVAVQTPTLWGWIGVGIVVLVLAGLFGTFRVYGRR